MDWLKRHKDEILKLTIVSVISLIIFNVLMAAFNWTVLNVPVLVNDSGSFLSQAWVSYAAWGEEKVTMQPSRFLILSLLLTICTFFMQFFFWGFKRKFLRGK
jgi:hypothetical protein